VESREKSSGIEDFSNSSATDVSLKPAGYHPNHHRAGSGSLHLEEERIGILDTENQEQEKDSVRMRDKEKGGGGR